MTWMSGVSPPSFVRGRTSAGRVRFPPGGQCRAARDSPPAGSCSASSAQSDPHTVSDPIPVRTLSDPHTHTVRSPVAVSSRVSLAISRGFPRSESRQRLRERLAAPSVRPASLLLATLQHQTTWPAGHTTSAGAGPHLHWASTGGGDQSQPAAARPPVHGPVEPLAAAGEIPALQRVGSAADATKRRGTAAHRPARGTNSARRRPVSP